MTQTKWEQISGKWKRFSGEVKKRWGSLTDDELTQVNGRREVLVSKIRENYGIGAEEANRQIDDWANKQRI